MEDKYDNDEYNYDVQFSPRNFKLSNIDNYYVNKPIKWIDGINLFSKFIINDVCTNAIKNILIFGEMHEPERHHLCNRINNKGYVSIIDIIDHCARQNELKIDIYVEANEEKSFNEHNQNAFQLDQLYMYEYLGQQNRSKYNQYVSYCDNRLDNSIYNAHTDMCTIKDKEDILTNEEIFYKCLDFCSFWTDNYQKHLDYIFNIINNVEIDDDYLKEYTINYFTSQVINESKIFNEIFKDLINILSVLNENYDDDNTLEQLDDIIRELDNCVINMNNPILEINIISKILSRNTINNIIYCGMGHSQNIKRYFILNNKFQVIYDYNVEDKEISCLRIDENINMFEI